MSEYLIPGTDTAEWHGQVFVLASTQPFGPSIALSSFFLKIEIADLLLIHGNVDQRATMAPNFQIEIESLPVDRSAGFHQKVMDGIEDLLLVLAEDGRVVYASSKSYSHMQIKPEALFGRYISTYMNVDDIPVFLVQWKENMALGSTWRSHHRLRQGDDTYKPFESTFKPYTDKTINKGAGSRTSTKLCLMTSRPYQITSTLLMDSFLEHYTTNIRLMNQLAQLKGEAEEFQESTTSTEMADTTVQCATFKLEATTATETATVTATLKDKTTTVSFSRVRCTGKDLDQDRILAELPCYKETRLRF